MDDTASRPVPTDLCLPALPPTGATGPPARSCAVFVSLADASAKLDELERQGRAGELIVLAPALFAVEWT